MPSTPRSAHRNRVAATLIVLLALFGSRPSPAAAQSVEQGRFGRGIQIRDSYAAAAYNPIYSVTPRTVELWAKLGSKAGTNILLAAEPRHSRSHWELYAEKGTGVLCAGMPGFDPKLVKGDREIADGKWHYLAMTFDGQSIKLFVDGKQTAAASDVRQTGPYPDTGPLTFGRAEGQRADAQTFLDEVRISRVVRPVERVPDGPFASDVDTVALWHFDEDPTAYDRTGFADASKTNNPARLELLSADEPDNGGFDNTRGGRTRWADMDYGPFFSSTLGVPLNKANVTPKAITIALDKEKKHAIAFDTELLRVSAGWTGGFIKMYAGREGLAAHPDAGGKPQFQTAGGPGWAKPGSEQFDDPRPDKLGPLPREWARYGGLYVHGDTVVLKYTVGHSDVLESFTTESDQKIQAIGRIVEIGPSSDSLTLNICDVANVTSSAAEGQPQGPTPQVCIQSGEQITCAGLVGASKGIKIKLVGAGQILVEVPPHEETARFEALVWSDQDHSNQRFADLLMACKGPRELRPLTKGGPARYPQPIETKGDLGKPAPRDDGAYVVDTLTAPDDNPWKSFLRFSGHDFFSNGDAAVCSISGDVWVVSGIDDKLDHLKWRRFATGLFQPLGLKIVNDQVYVLGRDQITRLVDLNGDGEADFYENFNNDGKVTPGNAHAYTTCLETDPQGNFYYVKSGDGSAHGGTVLRVSKDGAKLDVFATGIRNSTGLGMSPTGVLTHADNQGEWVPASRIDIVRQGSFLGFTPMSHTPTPPTDPGKPIVWMPQDVDNSSGGQVWVDNDRWGIPKGEMLHTSYGAAALLHVMTEEVDGVTQGAVWRFPFRFASGIMRGRFRPQDGQLYVSGLRGWQTAGVRDGCLQRVRYTGKPLHQPASFHARKNGILLGFTCPLDRKTAEDPDSWSVLQWNYRWSANYGSPHLSVRNPPKQGYDTLTVKSAKVLPDGKTVFLEIADMRPAMTTKISYNLSAADGFELRQDVHATIYNLGEEYSGAQAFRYGEPQNGLEYATTIKTPVRALPVRGSVKVVVVDAPREAADARPQPTDGSPTPKKIVFIAGKKSHGPGEHEYEKGCRLLADCLEHSPNVKNIKTEVITDGWPADERVLDDADTIFLYCDGSDQDEARHPLLHDDRLAKLGRLMDRGVGLVVVHYTVFVPTKRGGREFQDWVGGYFDYDSQTPPGADVKDHKFWYSQLGQADTKSTPLDVNHPILRGVTPFATRTEYYWKMRFNPDDKGLVPLLTFDPSKVAPPVRESVVAFAVERPARAGGVAHRGFAFTEGHFHSNWQIESFRRLVLNGIVWTAHADVPEGGVRSEVKR